MHVFPKCLFVRLIKNDFHFGHEPELNGFFTDLFTHMRAVCMYFLSVCLCTEWLLQALCLIWW